MVCSKPAGILGRLLRLGLGIALPLALSGEVLAQDQPYPQEDAEEAPVVAVNDPLEGFNRVMFRINYRVVTYALRSLNRGYELVVPRPARKGLGNAFDNVNFPVRFTSSLLQGKVRLATKETGKFVVNTVGGIGGLFRPAEKIPALANLPEEDMGQVFGKWHIPPGPYLVLPFLGPSSPRELVGFVGDYALSPLNWDTLKVGNKRWIHSDYETAVSIAGFMSKLPMMVHSYDTATQDAFDPYIAMRDAYVSHRAAEVTK